MLTTSFASRDVRFLAFFLAPIALSVATGARADEPTTTVPAPTPAPVPIATPTPTPVAAPAPKVEAATDHDLVVGRWGLGYFGEFDVPIGAIGARVAGGTAAIQLIGVRRWFGRWRLDLAAGVALDTGSATTAGTSADQPSTLVLGGRVAVPYALWVDQHFTVFVGPEVAYAHAGETDPGSPGTQVSAATADITHSGYRLSVGARAGAEVQFGFLGLPRLSLDATIALTLDATGGSSDGVVPSGSSSGNTATESFSHVSLASVSGNQPWNIFFSNVAAVYYF
jgi:hypothetical protein